MLARLRHLFRKEFIQILRDPRLRFVVFVTPLIQLVLFGYAATTDIRRVTLAVADLDRTERSRRLVRELASTDLFDVVWTGDDERRAAAALATGDALVAIAIPPGFTRALARRRTAPLSVVVDGTNSNVAAVVTGDVQSAIARHLARDPALARPAPAAFDVRVWFNPDLASRVYNVPAIIAQLMLLTSLVLTSAAIVREREAGTLEQLMVTPLTRVELVLGKTVPFAVVGALDAALVTLVARLWFAIPLRGSALLLAFSSGLYLLSTLGLGLLISTVSRTQQQAMMSNLLFQQPAMLLSGFLYPIENMPAVVQALTLVNPLRHFIVVLRGIFLRGVGVAELWPELAWLAAIGVVLLTLATLRFQRTLD